MKNKLCCKTRDSLLENACEAFAEKGFNNTTIREIAFRAGANIASIKYHFGSKKELYRQVWHYAHEKADLEFPLSLDIDAEFSAEERLNLFVLMLLSRAFSHTGSGYLNRLLAREMIVPSHAGSGFVEETIKQQKDVLENIISAFLKSETIKSKVQFITSNIYAHCIFMNQKNIVHDDISGNRKKIDNSIDEITSYAVQYFLAGIKEIKDHEFEKSIT